MVAKSYQNLEIIDEPHYKTRSNSYHSAPYVTVRTKTGATKEVRWYSDKEYAKMYPEEVKTAPVKTQKEILGFDNGYITIFKGNTYEDRDYFKLNSARYTKLWGWYFISTESLPDDLPDDVEPVRLMWEDVGNDDGTLKAETIIQAAVDKLIYEEDTSEYQGEVGSKIDRVLTVEKAVELDGYYGRSIMHIMRDDDRNCYVWTTAARSWEAGTRHHVAGTVKEWKQYKGTKQTVLTRCREI